VASGARRRRDPKLNVPVCACICDGDRQTHVRVLSSKLCRTLEDDDGPCTALDTMIAGCAPQVQGCHALLHCVMTAAASIGATHVYKHTVVDAATRALSEEYAVECVRTAGKQRGELLLVRAFAKGSAAPIQVCVARVCARVLLCEHSFLWPRVAYM
jgi:hypothetical protein